MAFLSARKMLDECTTTQVVINEDAVLAANFEGTISDDDLKALYDEGRSDLRLLPSHGGVTTMPTATPTKTKRVTKKVAAPPPPPVASNGTRGQIQVRLPQDLIDRLDVEAERRRVSKTFLVEQALAVMLPKLEEQSIEAV